MLCAEQPIAEGNEAQPDPVREAVDRSASIPEVPAISEWNSYDDLDFSSKRSSQKSIDPAFMSGDATQPKLAQKESRRFSIGDPFVHLRMCKKKRNCTQCRYAASKETPQKPPLPIIYRPGEVSNSVLRLTKALIE